MVRLHYVFIALIYTLYKVLCRLFKGTERIKEIIIFLAAFRRALYQLCKCFIPTLVLHIKDKISS